MPLDRATKAVLRDRVSLANKSNVSSVIEAVEKACATLVPGDKDFERLQNWLVDLRAISEGAVMGKS